jgi:hypothetical protein
MSELKRFSAFSASHWRRARRFWALTIRLLDFRISGSMGGTFKKTPPLP